MHHVHQLPAVNRVYQLSQPTVQFAGALWRMDTTPSQTAALNVQIVNATIVTTTTRFARCVEQGTG